MLKKWTIASKKTESAPFVSGLGTLADDILAVRGIDDIEKSRDFFSANKLYNPFLMKDMAKAVEKIKETLANGDKITIYGDYDCDGITSTVMLYSYLTALGGEIGWYIPSRDEGYGLNCKAIESIAEDGTKLIITVDNGISAFNEAALIKEKGISLIITDHHTAPSDGELPIADAIINPKQNGCEYPFKDLAGCGVVLKLITALENSAGFDSNNNDNLDYNTIEQYGDLAAIGTIADVVPLIDENRHIVSLGLQNISCTENAGLYRLMKKAGLSDDSGIDSTMLAFYLCPRLNAAGRFSHPSKAVELLLCENSELAQSKAEELSALNVKRGEVEREIIAEIETHIESNPDILNQRVLILSGKGWHHGVIGIISAKMVNRFGKPCIVITSDGETAKGSCRSVAGTPEFSIHKALTFCGDLLESFGGHSKAGGFSLKDENIALFKERLLEYARLNFDTMPAMEVAADCVLNPTSLTIENIEKLEALQPFGEGNPQPIFSLPECVIKSKRPLKDGKYTLFIASYKNIDIKVLEFSQRYDDFWYNIGDKVDIMLTFGINEYNSTKEISAKVVDMRLSGISQRQDRFFAAKSVYEKILRNNHRNCNEEVDSKLYPRIIPADSDMRSVYALFKASRNLDEVIQRGLNAGINYCMLRVAADVFAEMGLIELNSVKGEFKLIKATQKADLSQSELLKGLKAKSM